MSHAGRRPLNRCALHDQGNRPGRSHLLAFFDQGVMVERGAHDFIDHVKGRQRRGVDFK